MSSELVDLCAYMCDETKQPGLITTEEEFKKMENAVNNLLITKKQIDSLSNERNSLMLLYENKINEQNSQIKYLEEENYFLKLKLEQQNSTDGEQWRQKYEQSLDNIMRQLLSSLKTQETIRAEFMNLDQADNELDSLISTSNSWTFKGLNLNKSHRVQELLMLQQKQQLNLLNELSEISKSLKTNCHSQHTNHSSSTSSNHDSKEDKTEIKIDSSRSSQTNILNCSTLSNNSQSSNPRPSRIPKLSVAQKTVNQTKAAESAKKARYPSSTRIPQRARPSTPKTSHKNLPFSEPKTASKVINSTTFDKSVAHISDSCIVPECKEVKLFINKNLVDILLVAKNSEPKTRGRDDEGYSTMSSEIMHRAQNSNRTSAGNTETQSRTSEASSTIDETNSLSSPPPNLHNSKKRYCFPTLKTLNYYYNNRYYHQYHKRASSQSSIVCCKYLSDSDIQALSNQLNSFDKDTFYNVFHLDTLYSNVDYILFNSYASDTELEYNYNRRHGRYHDVLDSNYQLYINDYFNQPYDDDEDDDERQSATETEESRDSEENFVEYELKDDQFEFEIDGSNENFVELSVDGTDGLLFDDEDVNLILDSEQIDENFCLNEYKNMFDQSKFDSPLFSSQSISSLKSTSCSSSSCEYPSSNDLSLDSINPKVEKNSASLNCDYFVDSYDNYQLHDENVMLIDEQSLDNNFDISDFVNQLNKQCKSDKLLINTESSAKKLKEMTIKEATRMIEKTENESKTIRPSLVRRHTITTMPISAACLVKDNTFGNLNGKYSQHGCQTPTDFAAKDTKAFVGSFTHTSNSHTSTPLRRAETLYRKHTYIPEDNEQVNTPKSIKLANSVGSTPAKVSNNFNNDFYRLCTDTFFDGSEPNFANSQSDSVNSLPFKLKQVESEHLDDLQSNVSSHVNNLFDQWLVNSKN